MNKAFERFKALADLKKNVYDEDLVAIVTEETVRGARPLRAARTQRDRRRAIRDGGARRRCDCGSTARSAVDEGDGDGMVDACYRVISKIIGMQPKLERYAVKAITGGTDALGEVSCLINVDGVSATGQGAHTDIIQASALAYINALNKLEYRRASLPAGARRRAVTGCSASPPGRGCCPAANNRTRQES